MRHKLFRRLWIAFAVGLFLSGWRMLIATARAQGVNPSILSAKGFGDKHPVASNDTPDGRGNNRRIEIVMEGLGA